MTRNTVSVPLKKKERRSILTKSRRTTTFNSLPEKNTRDTISNGLMRSTSRPTSSKNKWKKSRKRKQRRITSLHSKLLTTRNCTTASTCKLETNSTLMSSMSESRLMRMPLIKNWSRTRKMKLLHQTKIMNKSKEFLLKVWPQPTCLPQDNSQKFTTQIHQLTFLRCTALCTTEMRASFN